MQKSVKEVREYVENGITPEGLTQSVQDPEAHSSSEEEKSTPSANESKDEGSEVNWFTIIIRCLVMWVHECSLVLYPARRQSSRHLLLNLNSRYLRTQMAVGLGEEKARLESSLVQVLTMRRRIQQRRPS